jgi:hypothetical protein
MKKNIAALLIFMILTAVMTYPVVLKMSNHIPGQLEDPLFVTWILGWDIHKIRTGLSGYWNANIFYPHNLTLAYSDNLTGTAILGLPVMLITDNIIFTYNFLFLLAFVLSGFGAYLLVKHLTGNFPAGIIGGIIFAFGPFHLIQYFHLPIIVAQWIPFAFLYLHKFFEKYRPKHLVLFVLFYVIQCFSSLQNGIFMSVFVLLFLVYYITQNKVKEKKALLPNRPTWPSRLTWQIAIALIFVFIVLLPFSYPYIKAKRHYGFQRRLSDTKNYSAHIESYLTAHPTNRIYGKLTRRLWQHGGEGGIERELFIGLIATFLAFIGFWPAKIKTADRVTHSEKMGRIPMNHSPPAVCTRRGFLVFRDKRKLILSIWYILILFYSLIIVLSLSAGGKISILSAIKPFTTFSLLIIIRWCSDKLWRQKIKTRLSSIGSNERFYLYTVILAVLFTFGPEIKLFREAALPGPYSFLFYLVPGFSSIRVPARFAIMVLLGVCVLAGYGYKKLLERFRSPAGKSILGMALIILPLMEYLSIPLNTPAVKTGENIPPVYKWLSAQKDDAAIIELPLHPIYLNQASMESLYIYYSTYHWKRTANGCSSYFPPTYIFLTAYFSDVPSLAFINSLRMLGIKYLIIHSEKYGESTWQKIYQQLDKHRSKILPVGKFGSAFVYRILKSSFSLTRPEEPDPGLLISKKGWSAESNASSKRSARYAIDTKLKTWWHTEGPKKPGQYFQLDLGKIYEFNRIWLSMGAHFYEYPENYKLEVSEDNKNWKVIKSEENILPELFLSALYFFPSNPKMDIQFSAQKARYIRITQYGKHEFYEWAIHEIGVQGLPERK